MHHSRSLHAQRWLARVAALLAVSLGFAALVPATANAADASDFNPGYLVSDEDFFNSTAMTSTQVDSFIRSMNKGCLTGRVCLENYKETITAKAKNSRCEAIAAASNRTAGQIIAAVGKACGISPKAIVVILQKEQSLITLQAPSATAFQASMGAGCPDTAPCDGRYAGFYENVYYGAYLLKGYTIPGSSNYDRYPAGKTTKIAYSPNSYKATPTCGFKSVYVQNQATHALYVYTPYTPNAAALANLYGTGDSCSAYGNRNFWRLWNDWFGPSGAIGVAAIAELYATLGGTTSTLGAPVGAAEANGAFGGGLLQRYDSGAIAWTEKYGARVMSPAILARWDSAGGASAIGWPRDAITTLTTDLGVGKYQTYDSGLIVWTQGKGTFRVYGVYQKALASAGGFAGSLGWPAAEASADAQEFKGAWVFYNRPAGSTTIVDSRIAAAFASLGGPAKWGNATSAAVATDANGGGVYQDFTGARVAVSTVRGSSATYGAYLSVWKSAGGPAGVLGWPVAKPFVDSTSGYSAQTFEGGTVYSGKAGKGYVATVFAGAVAKAGGVTGKYGFPSSGLRSTATGVGQDFVGWTLANTEEGGTRSLNGASRSAWIAYKAEAGVLGWPVAQAVKGADGVTTQKFEGGTTYVTGTKRAYVGEHFVATLTAGGGVSGKYGWPTSGLIASSSNGGGEVQKFGATVLTWREGTNVRSVYGTLVAPWYASKAYSGPLGWPTGGQGTDAPSKARFQDFQGGRLYALGTKNGYVATALVSAFVTAGGPSGSWGWPTAAPKTTDGILTQAYAKGTATFDGTTVTFAAK